MSSTVANRYANRHPPVGLPVERLLREFGQPLLDALAKRRDNQSIYDSLLRQHTLLKSAWEARRMVERLATQAELAATRAETQTETEIQGLFEAMASSPSMRINVFEQGLALAIEPRGHAQVFEARRLVERVSTSSDAPPAVSTALTALSASALALAARLAALEGAEQAVVEALVYEQRAEWSFRREVRRSEGALRAQAMSSEEIGDWLGGVQSSLAEHTALPPAPPPTNSSLRKPKGRG